MNHSTSLWAGLLILLFSIHLSAQTLTDECHRPQSSDSLFAYKMPYVAVGDSGRNCVWDFTELPIDSAEIIPVDYYATSATDTTYIGLHREHANYYMHCQSDTLWQTGYETSKCRLQYLFPLPLLCFPFAYGDTIIRKITGNGQYCHNIPLQIDGNVYVHADAIGRLVLPDCTIDSILRAHSIIQYSEMRHRPTLVKEERYVWYSTHFRYPVIETVKVQNISHTDTTSIASIYYYQQEYENVLKQQQTKVDIKPDSTDSLLTEINFLPNPVLSDLQVCYTLVRDAHVYISVHYNGGVATFTTPEYNEVQGSHRTNINMSGMPTGNYVVYIHADDTIISGNVIKL